MGPQIPAQDAQDAEDVPAQDAQDLTAQDAADVPAQYAQDVPAQDAQGAPRAQEEQGASKAHDALSAQDAPYAQDAPGQVPAVLQEAQDAFEVAQDVPEDHLVDDQVFAAEAITMTPFRRNQGPGVTITMTPFRRNQGPGVTMEKNILPSISAFKAA